MLCQSPLSVGRKMRRVELIKWIIDAWISGFPRWDWFFEDTDLTGRYRAKFVRSVLDLVNAWYWMTFCTINGVSFRFWIFFHILLNNKLKISQQYRYSCEFQKVSSRTNSGTWDPIYLPISILPVPVNRDDFLLLPGRAPMRTGAESLTHNNPTDSTDWDHEVRSHTGTGG